MGSTQQEGGRMDIEEIIKRAGVGEADAGELRDFSVFLKERKKQRLAKLHEGGRINSWKLWGAVAAPNNGKAQVWQNPGVVSESPAAARPDVYFWTYQDRSDYYCCNTAFATGDAATSNLKEFVEAMQ